MTDKPKILHLYGSIDDTDLKSRLVVPTLMLLYKIGEGSLFPAAIGTFLISDEETRKDYSQHEEQTYLGAIFPREEGQDKHFIPDFWKIDSGRRVGSLALPENELQPVPNSGIRMPGFWWAQIKYAQDYHDHQQKHGTGIADRFIELKIMRKSDSEITGILGTEFNI